MKIVVLGYSGSGKSTLATILSKKYDAPLLHLDSVQFESGWQVRDDEEKKSIVYDFLEHNSSWVIDGNYSKLYYERRMEEADIIIILLFNRINCLYRARKRYIKYKGTTRPDMTNGCNEKFDKDFIKWILFGGRTREVIKRNKNTIRTYRDKTIVIKNQRQLSQYINNLNN